MARQYPVELYLGQKVLVRLDPTAHPVPALVTKIDRDLGVIHVNPIGYKVRWQARPRAVSSPGGYYLHFDDTQNYFYFDTRRNLA